MTLKEIAEKFGGQLWMKADKIRIYFDYGDDIKAFLEYDEDLGDEFQTGIEGANLKYGLRINQNPIIRMFARPSKSNLK